MQSSSHRIRLYTSRCVCFIQHKLNIMLVIKKRVLLQFSPTCVINFADFPYSVDWKYKDFIRLLFHFTTQRHLLYFPPFLMYFMYFFILRIRFPHITNFLRRNFPKSIFYHVPDRSLQLWPIMTVPHLVLDLGGFTCINYEYAQMYII